MHSAPSSASGPEAKAALELGPQKLCSHCRISRREFHIQVHGDPGSMHCTTHDGTHRPLMTVQGTKLPSSTA